LPDKIGSDRETLALARRNGCLALVGRQIELQRGHDRHRGDLFHFDEHVAMRCWSTWNRPIG
jgi:hypothetical protein